VRVVEGRVVAGGVGARLAALDHGAKLLAERDPEVKGGTDALCRERQAVARRVAAEEDPVLGRPAKLVRDPVPLVADRVAFEVLGEQDRRVLDVKARVE